MPAAPTAKSSGQFQLGGDTPVNRLGFGALRIRGQGAWGEPENRDEAIRLLKRLPDLGVDFIDTADSYGPFVSEDLIAEARRGVVGLSSARLRRVGGTDLVE
jgi:pyridoxine 4-dehydrogenase